MIVSRTPLRISFVGGGTDFPRWYKGRYGCVVGAAIDKYMNVTVNRRFEGGVRVAYTKTEIVEDFEDLEHDLIRECMRLTGVTKDVEIVTVADVPGRGTGLGSSSAVTVGVLHALRVYKADVATSDYGRVKRIPIPELAHQACVVELEMLKKPIGKQDQMFCAYGGLATVEFSDAAVQYEQHWGRMAYPERHWLKEFSDRLMLFYFGTTRDGNEILAKQDERTEMNDAALINLTWMARMARSYLFASHDYSQWPRIGKLMHDAWELKKSLAPGITDVAIDICYEAALDAGALGGKVCGAGGGGFMLLYVEREKQAAVREALSALKELPFGFDYEGTTIIHAD